MSRDAATLASLPVCFTVAEAATAGVSVKVVGRLAALDQIERVHRGTYRKKAATLDDEAAHRQRVVSTLAHLDGYVASHVSAAVLQGYRVSPALVRGAVHVTATNLRRPSRHLGNDIVIHHDDSQGFDAHVVDGLPATSPARTCADVLRMLGSLDSVPILDSAIHAETVTRDDIQTVLASQVRWTGRRRALARLALVDGRRESWLESRSFVWLWHHGFPLPVPQVTLLDLSGAFVARLDGVLPHAPVACEVDGAGKYAAEADSDSTQGADRAAALIEEKLREDAIRDLGAEVVRWMSRDLRLGSTLVGRVQRAQERAHWSRFQGQLEVIDPLTFRRTRLDDPRDLIHFATGHGVVPVGRSTWR